MSRNSCLEGYIPIFSSAVDLSKREVSLGSVSRDIDATSGNIYARDGNAQLSGLVQSAVAQGSLSPSDAESLLGKIR